MPIISSGARPKNKYSGDERRWYLRLDTVFPVQFRLVGLDAKTALSPTLLGFTNNLSKGGICLCAPDLPPELVLLLKEHKAKIALGIDISFLRKPIDAEAAVIWMREDPERPARYYLGLAYEKIDLAANNRLMRYARGKQLFIPAVLLTLVLLGLALALNGLINIRLTEDNRSIIRQLSAIIQESAIAKNRIREISKEKEGLGLKIQELTSRIQVIENEKAGLAGLKGKASIQLTEKSQKINEMNTLIQRLTQEKNNLKQELADVQIKESAITEELTAINEKKAVLEKANFEKMYLWVKAHQNPRTGLVASFEGDSEISGWAFTYDESLAAQAFAYFGELGRAKKILDFFNHQAAKKDGLFLNAYYANDGTPAEFIAHSGPNIWLGIAAAQYIYKTKDRQYLPLAESIATGIMNLQKQDAEGGIRGGPQVAWYATEHNLDAYAFFDMLFTLTHKQKYLESRNKILDWLVKNTYNQADIPIKRGKGDATIATDTYAWSIAAIGPDKLEELGMNPERIMQFAEDSCGVDVAYLLPDGGKIQIKGFDFAPQRHVARGGVVSSEWTAQMVISFKIMADYYLRKNMPVQARSYQVKADEYLAALSSMIICSPSASGQGENCLPYASQDFVDTGHGWFTPKGKATGSVSGTTYTIFAYYNYNPLKLKE